MSDFDFSAWIRDGLATVDAALDRWVGAGAPDVLCSAMRYAVLDGGKRLRPLLVLAAAEAAGNGVIGNMEYAVRSACALEMIHAYSLVHDDMPCMDNDLLRRGKPTVHVQHGEAMALLAGDALQAQAFELLAPAELPAEALQAVLCRELAQAAGGAGMAGGQAIDLSHVGKSMSETELRHMHEAKTGALLRASVRMGWLSQGGAAGHAFEQLNVYAKALGLAFQVVDDILDVTADSATLGKTAGKDAENNKPTYVSVLGLDRSRAYAAQLRDQALAALAQSGLSDTRALRALALMVVDRQH